MSSRNKLDFDLSDEALDAMMRATAATIRLDIREAYVAGTRENLRALLAVAQTLIEADAPAQPVVEMALVYRA